LNYMLLQARYILHAEAWAAYDAAATVH